MKALLWWSFGFCYFVNVLGWIELGGGWTSGLLGMFSAICMLWRTYESN